jgi:hypothetical protein
VGDTCRSGALQALLTPEYQAIFEAVCRPCRRRQGNPTDRIPDGMPRAMNVIFPMEIGILPWSSTS